MKTLLRGLFLLVVVFTASLAYGAVPHMKVTVFHSNGAVAFTGMTDSNGSFATTSLAPGRYIVQFNSTNAKDNTYALVISAGSKKVVADAVAARTTLNAVIASLKAAGLMA